MKFKAIVIGVSSGGIAALKILLPELPASFSIPIIVVLHIGANSNNYWIESLNNSGKILIKEADEKEKIKAGVVYVAPANYHLLIERDETFSLSTDERVNYARPSIDVLFESAADVFEAHLMGLILTGANNDGAKGLKKIKDKGGLAIVQDPETADSKSMPLSAIAITKVDYIFSLEEIKKFLFEIELSQLRRN